VDIDEALVRRVAHLSRLELTDDEVHAMAPQLARIFQHVDRVGQLDLGPDAAKLDPATQAPIGIDALRDEVPCETLDPGGLLRNAPAHDGAFLVVPRFLGTEKDGRKDDTE